MKLNKLVKIITVMGRLKIFILSKIYGNIAQ